MMLTEVKEVREGYKVTELGEIPEEWEVKYVNTFSSIGTGKKDTKDKQKNGEYPFFVRSQTIESIDSYSYDGEAILTAGDGVGVGKVFHYINGKFDYHQRVYKISDFKNVSGKFFFYYFSENFMKQVRKFNAKTSVDSVRLEMIAKMPIPIPTTEEQQKIAEILSTVDETIETTDQLLEKTKELKKGLMQQLLTKGIGHTEFKKTELGEIPVEWDVVKIADIAKNDKNAIKPGPFGSALKKEFYKNNGYKIYGQEQVISNDFNKGNYYIDEKKFQELKSFEIKTNDLLISLVGTFGKTSVVPESIKAGIINPRLLKVTFDQNKANVWFYKYFMSSITFYSQLKKMSQVGTMGVINGKTLKSMIFPFPPIKEQQEIVKILLSVDEKIEGYEKEKGKLHELKKGLMQQLLTGKIRVSV